MFIDLRRHAHGRLFFFLPSLPSPLSSLPLSLFMHIYTSTTRTQLQPSAPICKPLMGLSMHRWRIAQLQLLRAAEKVFIHSFFQVRGGKRGEERESSRCASRNKGLDTSGYH
jgi:hypothetical protein